MLSLIDVDIAERIQHTQQATLAFEKAGYKERMGIAIGNLALVYWELGLYPHSARLQSEVVEINRDMGAKLSLAYGLANLVDVEISLGKLDSIRAHIHELAKIVPSIGDPNMDSALASNLGGLAMAEGDFKTAIRHHKHAAQIVRTAGTEKENIYLTMLGQAQLANGDPTAALKSTNRATNLHRAQNFAIPDGFPAQEIWWRHTQVLLADKKTKEAREALDRAHEFLLEQIANLRDEGLRRNYLNKVNVNRELLQYWVKDGTKRKLPKERLFAHLAIESNLREPFKRLADTGLRLNALKTVSEIQTFLVEEATELSGGERVMLILEKDGVREVMEAILPLPSYASGKGYEKAEDPKDVLRGIGKYLDQARLTRTVQLILPHPNPSPSGRGARGEGKGRIIAPLIAQNHVIGYLYVDMDSLYGTFDGIDRDLLGMLANQAAVALDNAQWAQGLERKVEERTEELNARVDELAILNSVGEAMAQTLDVKTVTKIVGDKVRDIFQSNGVSIMLLDTQTNMIHVHYEYDEGEGGYVDYIEPFPLGKGMTTKVIKSRQPLLIGTTKEGLVHGAYLAPESIEQGSGVIAESTMMVPIIVSDKVLGVAMVTSYKQYAFNENDLRLLQTLSANMGVAIENARLFQAEQERVAELQIINSIQQGLAAELDIQAIFDLVGDKIRETFHAQVVLITTYDRQTNLRHFPYLNEKGERKFEEARPFSDKGFGAKVMLTRQPLMINEDYDKYAAEVGTLNAGNIQAPKSAIFAPLVTGDEYAA